MGIPSGYSLSIITTSCGHFPSRLLATTIDQYRGVFAHPGPYPMPHRPTFDEFAALARGAHASCRSTASSLGDTLTPVTRLLQDPGRRLVVPVRERRRRRAARPLQLPRLRAVPALRGVRHAACAIADRRRAEVEELEHADPLRLLEEMLAAYRAPHLPGPAAVLRRRRRLRRLRHRPLRRAAAERRRPTTAACPTSASPSTTAWSSSTTSTRPSPSSPTPTSSASDLRAQLRRRLPPRRSTGRAAAAGRRRPAADRHRPAGGAGRASPYRVELHAGSSSRPRSRSARNTSRPATSSRSCSASGSQTETTARPFDIYRALRVVNPSPFMFYLQGRRRSRWSALAGDHGAASRATVITIRPLAGTRRRGATPEEDDAPGRGTARRSQGAGRAHHARRPGPQRRRPGRRLRHASSSAT